MLYQGFQLCLAIAACSSVGAAVIEGREAKLCPGNAYFQLLQLINILSSVCGKPALDVDMLQMS